MKANPGGEIDPSEVFGRDKLIKNLWRILERQSVVISAERRMGKTCVIKKMQAEAPSEKLIVYRELERVHTALEFAEIVFQDVEGYLSRSRKAAVRVRQFLAHLAGGEIGGVIKFPPSIASHWKTLLVKTIEDLIEHQEHTVVFFWDELPLMIYNIKQREGESVATELLDTLRSLRQTHKQLRMGFTGSIGLHNVITALKRSGYANAPTNDMYTINVDPLAFADAQNLAVHLLQGEAIQTPNMKTTAKAIAQTADCMPFYIHHIVDQIAQQGIKATPGVVNDIVNRCLTEPQDIWHLGYYRERIDTYYDKIEREFALTSLDILCTAKSGIDFAQLFNLLKAKVATEDEEGLREVLKLLQRDHYVLQQSNGTFRLRSRLIQRWWRIHRGI